MPVVFPVLDAESGALVDTEHYSLAEFAERLHMSETTARRLANDEHWPHLRVAKRVWFSGEDMAAIIAAMRHNDSGVAEHNGTPVLGEPLPEDPWDSEAGPADQDPGGVR